MGAWGAYLLLNHYRRFKDKKTLILYIAFCLSTISSLTGLGFPSSSNYYLGFWYVLCSILGSGCNLMSISEKLRSLIKKSVIVGIFISLLVGQNLIRAITHRNTYFSEDKKEISELIKYCKGGACLIILPLHPIFSYDATRLYSYWQFYLMDEFSSIREDAKNKDIARVIINERPAVVMYKFYKRDFLLELFQKKLITALDYKKLVSLFKENYTVRQIGRRQYYIRNDRL
jgi:hypothetical protein